MMSFNCTKRPFQHWTRPHFDGEIVAALYLEAGERGPLFRITIATLGDEGAHMLPGTEPSALVERRASCSYPVDHSDVVCHRLSLFFGSGWVGGWKVNVAGKSRGRRCDSPLILRIRIIA